MEHSRLGNTGLTVSRLALGTMTFGWQIDEQGADRIVDEALDRGVTFIDTADSYEGSEAILGKVLAGGKRDKITLATKVYVQRANGGRAARNSRANILACVENSLALLRTDRIDLYQLHHPDPDTPGEETLAALDTLVKAGKVRYVGTSNHFAWQAAYMQGLAARHGWEPPVSSQTCYNLLDRPAEVEVIPFCRKFNVAFLVFSPLCGGVLSGKYRKGETPAADTRAGAAPTIKRFTDNPAVHDLVAAIDGVAREQGVTLAQLAVLWLLAKPVVTSVLLGGSKAEHFSTIYGIADRKLAPEVVAKLDEITASQVYKAWRNQSRFDAPLLSPHR